MDLGELLPILLGILWVIVIPIIRSNQRNKAKQKPVTVKDDDQDFLAEEQESPKEDLFKELFGLNTEEPKKEPVKPVHQPIEQNNTKQKTYRHVESVAAREGVSAFKNKKIVKSPATFSSHKETIYKGAGGNVKENIRQAVIFSEILRRPYAD